MGRVINPTRGRRRVPAHKRGRLQSYQVGCERKRRDGRLVSIDEPERAGGGRRKVAWTNLQLPSFHAHLRLLVVEDTPPQLCARLVTFYVRISALTSLFHCASASRPRLLDFPRPAALPAVS